MKYSSMAVTKRNLLSISIFFVFLIWLTAANSAVTACAFTCQQWNSTTNSCTGNANNSCPEKIAQPISRTCPLETTTCVGTYDISKNSMQNSCFPGMQAEGNNPLYHTHCRAKTTLQCPAGMIAGQDSCITCKAGMTLLKGWCQ